MTFTHNFGFDSISKGNMAVGVRFYVGQKGVIPSHVTRTATVEVPVIPGGSTQRGVGNIGTIRGILHSPFQPSSRLLMRRDISVDGPVLTDISPIQTIAERTDMSLSSTIMAYPARSVDRRPVWSRLMISRNVMKFVVTRWLRQVS